MSSNPVYQAAMELGQFMAGQRWRYCLIGGVAVIRWGQPRATRDVDVSLLTGFVILKAFAGRDRDWSDVQGILDRQSSLDWSYITQHLTDLCQLKDDATTVTRLNAMRGNVTD